MDSPLVSIIMPTYNRANLLAQAIRSIERQSFKAWELIVINDASTDETKNILDGFAGNDPRIRPVHNEKNNYPDISKNLNHGIGLARGAYIARLDDDDYWCDDDKLKKQVDFFGTIVVDQNNKERYRYFKLETDEEIRNKIFFANPFTHSTVMFRKEIAQSVGGYGNFKNAEDWELWFKMGGRGRFYNFQDYFVCYLMTDANKSNLFKKSQSQEILKILKLHRGEYPNFYGGFLLNYCQYLYSCLPASWRRPVDIFLSRLKRTAFSA
jgi:glycosyltransferase involved in cell wall biosynthesis